MAGRIPQAFIDDLMARVDIAEVIDTRVPLKKAGRDLQACCPFHTEKTPSFTVSPSKQFYHCFGCGAHGTALGFLMEFEHMDFVEAVEDLARQAGLTVPRENTLQGESRAPSFEPLYQILDDTNSYYQQQLREHPDAKRAVDYLKQRGLSGEIAKTYGVGYAPPGWDTLVNHLGENETRIEQLLSTGLVLKKDNGGYYDRFRDRIQFPIRDRRGRVIGFGGRVLGDETPKYLNSPETPVFHKGRELYGLYEARKNPGRLERLLVVEGYMDVIALAQFDITYSVATLGTATTTEHLEQIFRLVPEVVFCFDGDNAGRKAAWRAMENTLGLLRDGLEARFMFLPDGEDPDSLIRKEGKDALEDRIANSRVCSNFFFQELLKQVKIEEPEGKAQLVKLARPLLSKVNEGVFKQLMVKRLGEIAGTTQLGKIDSPSRPQAIRRPPAQGNQPNPVRRAISLLLHFPKVAEKADLEKIASLPLPGIPLLVELVEYARAHAQATLGSILERWRDTEQVVYLEKLASKPMEVPESGAAREFLHTLELLVTQEQQRRLEALDAKQTAEGLTPAELNEWKQLLTVRHRPST